MLPVNPQLSLRCMARPAAMFGVRFPGPALPRPTQYRRAPLLAHPAAHQVFPLGLRVTLLRASPWREASLWSEYFHFHGMGDEGPGRTMTALLALRTLGVGKIMSAVGVELGSIDWHTRRRRPRGSGLRFPGGRAHDRKCCGPIKSRGGPSCTF